MEDFPCPVLPQIGSALIFGNHRVIKREKKKKKTSNKVPVSIIKSGCLKVKVLV